MANKSARALRKQSANAQQVPSKADSKMWQGAISEAERQIKDREAQIRELRRAIVTFKEMRDAGEPWPGTSEAQEASATSG